MDEILTKGKLLMKFLDFFWWFLDGDRSSGQIIKEKKQPLQQAQQTEEAHNEAEVDDFEEFEEFFD